MLVIAAVLIQEVVRLLAWRMHRWALTAVSHDPVWHASLVWFAYEYINPGLHMSTLTVAVSPPCFCRPSVTGRSNSCGDHS